MSHNSYKMKIKHKKDLEYIWGSIGFIIHLSSLIEHNVKLLISGEELLQIFDNENISILDLVNAKEESNKKYKENDENRVMLGMLIKQLNKYDLYKDSDLIEKLWKVSNIRGYYALEFLKRDLYAKHLESDPLFYKHQIMEDIDFLYTLNNELLETIKEYKKLGLKLTLNINR